MIDQATVEKIFDAAQIVEVVSDYVTLKKKGVNYTGLCPFHHEKTPSFIVSPAKGIFKCFGCGKGGNPVNFVMEHEQLPYIDALKFLAKKYNIEVKERELSADEVREQNERSSMLVVTEWAANFFHEQLLHADEGIAIGLSYFRERGFHDHTIKKFMLGYSPEKRTALTDEAQKSGFKLDYLKKSGLTIENDRGYKFDRFAGRVMFPIHDLSGKPIGFGGRVMKKTDETAKYLNSPESEIYHKSKTLYGLFLAKKAMVQQDCCYLVEGYTDVISMHQSGIENVVASSGTSLTTEQIRLIKRFTSNVTVLYDGDAAGIKASIRGIDMLLEEGLNIKVLLLPDGEDPDSFARKHSATEFIDFIKQHQTDFVLFKCRLLMEDAKNDPIKRATLIGDIVRSIALIPDTLIRSVYIKESATLLEISEQVLYTETNKLRRSKAEQKTPEPEAPVPGQQTPDAAKVSSLTPVGSMTEQQEKELIRLMLKYGNEVIYEFDDESGGEKQAVHLTEFVLSEIEIDGLNFSNPVYRQIFEEIELHFKKGTALNEQFYTQHPDPEIVKAAVDLLSTPYELSRIWTKNGIVVETEDTRLRLVVSQALTTFKSRKILEQNIKTQYQLLEAQMQQNTELMEELQQQVMALNYVKKMFAQKQVTI